MLTLKFFVFLFSYFGIFTLTVSINKKFLWQSINTCFKEKNIQDNSTIFFFSINWFITLSVVGIISSIFFYLDLENFYARAVLFFLGIVGLLLFFINKKKLKYIEINYIKNFYNIIGYKEKLIIFIIFIIFLIYLYKSFVPWFDNDEISQYGYFTKLISNGWTISDNLYRGFNLFAEAMYAPFYWVFDNTLIPRIIRIIGLYINSFLIYSLCRFLQANRFNSLLGSAAFLITPELATIGVSMKTDVVLLGYELSALLLFLLAILSIKNFKISNLTFSSHINNILYVSIFFSLIAVSCRISAVYSLIIISIFGIILFFINSKNYFILFVKLFFLLILSLLIFNGYIYNFIVYSNPLFPLGGPWMFLFPNGLYESFWNMSDPSQKLENMLNINIGIPIINEIYILFYHALGLEDPMYDFLNLKTNVGAASGWLNPVLLIIFIAPFYFYRSKEILIIFILFILLFIFWINGLQYSRIFIASSSLTIFIAVKIITIDAFSRIGNFIKKTISVLIILVIIFFSYYQYSFAQYYNPYFFVNEENIYKLNSRRVFNSTKWGLYDDTVAERNLAYKRLEKYINFYDYLKLKEIINVSKREILIFNNLQELENLHIFFNKGYFKIVTDQNLFNIKWLLLELAKDISKKENKELCLLSNSDKFPFIDKTFPYIIHKLNSGVLFRCMNKHI